MAEFHTYGPSGGELLFPFHYGQAGLPGGTFAPKRVRKRGQLHFFYYLLRKQFRRCPPEASVFARSRDGKAQMPWVMASKYGKSSSIWLPPILEKSEGIEPNISQPHT